MRSPFFQNMDEKPFHSMKHYQYLLFRVSVLLSQNSVMISLWTRGRYGDTTQRCLLIFNNKVQLSVRLLVLLQIKLVSNLCTYVGLAVSNILLNSYVSKYMWITICILQFAGLLVIIKYFFVLPCQAFNVFLVNSGRALSF